MPVEGNKGNWLTAMKEVLRSPSPVRSFDVPTSPAPSQGHRQSVDNFLSRLGPGVLDTSLELEERSGQPRRSSGRRSHEMNLNKGTTEAKQVQRSSNNNNSSSNGNQSRARSPNKLQMHSSSNTTMNNGNKKLQMQTDKVQVVGVNNNVRGNINTNIKPVMRHKGAMKTQEEHNNRHAMAVAAASAAAAEAAAMAAQAAAEVMRLTGYGPNPHGQYSPPPLDDFSLDDLLIASQAQRAATLIQSAYRGHLARQALRALKGLVKLQAVVRGYLVRRQAKISLRCMQALVRLQARVRARQVKTALRLAAATDGQGLMLPPAFLQPLPTHSNSQLQETPVRHHPRLSPFRKDASARSPALISPLLRPLDQSMQSQSHNRASDTFSRASSLISSEDSRDWDNSALSKEEIELKALKKQHALARRQKALSYAENQKTPTRSLGTPSRRLSNEYYQQTQQQRVNKSSFNETEPEKLHRDWSWLEGWMAAHGATSVWESNAAALWESRDERRDRDGVEEDNDPVFSGETEFAYEEYEEDEENATHSLLHGHINSDDDPAIKIIEMDRAATPPIAASSLSPYSSSRKMQHFNNIEAHHHHTTIPSSRLHHGALASSPQPSTFQPTNLRL